MRYYSEGTVKKIMEGVKVDYVPTSQYDSSLCTEKRTYPKLENYPSIEMPSPWHTGTPTEEGWYLIAYKPIEQDSPLVYYTWHQWRDAEGYWQSDGIRPNDFWKPIAWQKIEED